MARDDIRAASFFDQHFGVTSQDLDKVLGRALEKKADYADLYFEYRVNEAISLEERMVKNASRSTANGVGVRVLAESKTGYAYTDDITIQKLELAARTAQYIAHDQGSRLPVSLEGEMKKAQDLYPVKSPALDIPLERKIGLLHEMDRLARALDPRIKNVFVSLASEHKIVLIASSRGWVVGDIQPLTRLNITCIVEEHGNRQVGTYGGGGRVDFTFFTENKDHERYTREAVRQALLNLEAEEAPAGTMDVVL
ncbi:MAG: metalloprotease TldD, partial [Deltaproteobacteria bacterium]